LWEIYTSSLFNKLKESNTNILQNEVKQLDNLGQILFLLKVHINTKKKPETSKLHHFKRITASSYKTPT